MAKHPWRDLHRVMMKAGAAHRLSSGHHVYTLPGGAMVVMAGSPSDHRARRNVVANMRRVGLAA